ncbi:MAG: PQQ-binding-like beta-propeller repeat protein [Rhodopirellula sp.]|nr:PQQ-binding-like beta-propeller repeat protein [Rhodopirellula sp.]
MDQRRRWLLGMLLVVMSLASAVCQASDWPMWRRDAGRTGVTQDSLPAKLELKWVRNLPAITPAFHSPRLQFDAGYEPVVADGRLLVASSRNDSLTAYEASTGRELWVHHTNGPVRFASAVWKDSVCFGSDDGYLYCVELSTGRLRWKHQATPNDRRLLGNQRLISVWPVRGGPVVADGQVYFAAGVWPFEGVFVLAMDIATGEVIWRNERLGYLFGQQPHNTQAIGGLAPQGYLIVNDDEVIVPCSTAYPARLNRETGELIDFKLPAPGRLPGGWFAALDPESAKAVRRGKLTFDDVVNQQLHEDKIHKGDGETGISRTIHAGGRAVNFDNALAELEISGVEGKVHSMIVADSKLFVSTLAGKIYCFAESGADETKPTEWSESATPLETTTQATKLAASLIRESAGPYGVAIVIGLQDGALVKALLQESKFHVVAVDNDTDRVSQLRKELQAAGLYGTRAAVIEADPSQVSLPSYLASLITTELPGGLSEVSPDLLQTLRPFGGIALGIKSGSDFVSSENLNAQKPGRFLAAEFNGQSLIRRIGALPGTADYRGSYAHCEDTLVRFPLGVLWFDDTLAHFKRSPQPLFRNGVMVSRPKDWHAPRIKGNWSVDYPLMKPVLSDIYTGRVFDESEQAALRKSLPAVDLKTPQQSYYHAPDQKTALLPNPPDPILAGERINPLTGLKEPRVFPKTYGCDGGVDYGLFYTLRSGTAAFYDKTLESGTVFISGPRSGCTNSIIPSGGLLNVPYFYEGCTCSYPLPTALSMVAMPESHEQWSSWGDDSIKPATIERIGLNFGAPGDRKTRDGTLWLDYPSVGGPSPQIKVVTKPENPTFHYRHSNWIMGGEAWPWVAASAVEGLEELTLHDLKPGRYTVRLYFAELSNEASIDRSQTINLQGKTVLSDFKIVSEAEAPMTGIVREFNNIPIDNALTINLKATAGKSLISGIEVIKMP